MVSTYVAMNTNSHLPVGTIANYNDEEGVLEYNNNKETQTIQIMLSELESFAKCISSETDATDYRRNNN